MSEKSSIDPDELNKFNKTHFEWWDKEGEFKILHKINDIRIQYLTTKIKQHFNISGNHTDQLRNLNLLDVGCGGGLITVPMHKMRLSVTGLDANEHNIQASKSYANEHKLNINYLHTTIENHLESKTKYDIILCLEVLEHVANIEEFIINLSKLLTEGGMLIMSTINRTPKSYLLAIIAAEYILRWVPARTHDYNKFVKPSELLRLSQKTNLNLEELKGLVYSILDVEWRISDDIDVNYFAVFTN